MEGVEIPGTDLVVSRIAYGAARAGAEIDDGQVAALLNAYRDVGGTLIDTAHVYGAWATAGDGAIERVIARYLAANGGDDLVVATKGGHPSWKSYRRVDYYLSPDRIHADVQDSLGRLEVEQMDLYYLHYDDPRMPVSEVMEALAREVKAGRLRHVAASNWTPARLEEANAYAAEHALPPFVASQISFSLAQRDPTLAHPAGVHAVSVQAEDVAFHARTGMPLCAYNATGEGYFAGSREDGPYASSANAELRGRVKELAAQLGCTPTQVALAWMLRRPFPCIAITGTTSIAHLQENMAAADIAARDEIDSLNA